MPGGQNRQHTADLAVGYPVSLGKLVGPPVHGDPAPRIGNIIGLTMAGIKNEHRIILGRLLPQGLKKAAYARSGSLVIVELNYFVNIVVSGKNIPDFPGISDGVLQRGPALIPVNGYKNRPLFAYSDFLIHRLCSGLFKPPILTEKGGPPEND
jgi:hypothetical protein